jgi:hypothetical protein
MWTYKCKTKFLTDIVPSTLKMETYVSPKRRYSPAGLNDATSDKNIYTYEYFVMSLSTRQMGWTCGMKQLLFAKKRNSYRKSFYIVYFDYNSLYVFILIKVKLYCMYGYVYAS